MIANARAITKFGLKKRQVGVHQKVIALVHLVS